GYADCDGTAADGCEVNLGSDPAHCGSCGGACSTVNATPSCVNSTCVCNCAAGFGDCDNNCGTGCETSFNVDPPNCGGCAKACSNQNIAIPTCSGGFCSGSCNAGFADCDNDKLTNGCETNISGNVNACGACGAICSSQNGTATCTSGNCQIGCNT